MPPKKKKRPRNVVNIAEDEYRLECEWSDCDQVFINMDLFITHLTMHLTNYFFKKNLDKFQEFVCQWRECGTEVEGQEAGYLRHVYFHAFHVKIKCIGGLLVEKRAMNPCQIDSASRNLIPELPEKLQCGWKHCEAVYDNADIFYRHVENHADGYPDGNKVPGGCNCQWEGCETVVKSKHKLKEHLRSHTQEKIVGCPVCGGLFANRTKFFDHLQRQEETNMQMYQCSHCNKRFSTERLLRDHMRHHVNQYKCPYCEMTCPSPSCLRNHIRYRHTDEKPFNCHHCGYLAKSISDMKKHLETHNQEFPFNCHVQGCIYKARGYQSLANHFKRVHQKVNVNNYSCHVCNSQFTRGSLLTNHLMKKHKFHWPSGHSRFRYKLHEDGLWRLQTVRYESVELTTSLASEGQKKDDADSMSHGAHLMSDNLETPVAMETDDHNDITILSNVEEEQENDANSSKYIHTEVYSVVENSDGNSEVYNVVENSDGNSDGNSEVYNVVENQDGSTEVYNVVENVNGNSEVYKVIENSDTSGSSTVTQLAFSANTGQLLWSTNNDVPSIPDQNSSHLRLPVTIATGEANVVFSTHSSSSCNGQNGNEGSEQGQADDSMSYNLQMLGEVALAVPPT